MVRVIAARELRGLFLSPLAWTLLAVVQLVLAWLFLLLVEDYLALQPRLVGAPGAPGVTDLVAAPLLKVAAWVLLLVTPLLTMGLISGERRHRTLDLLLSSPVAGYQIVLGKYLGLLAFLALALALIALMPLSLWLGGALDTGKFAAGLLGLFLMVASFAAAGLYLSALAPQPAVAAVATFGLLLLLWVLDAAGQAREGGVLAYLSLPGHFNALLMGLFDSADVAYYLLFIVAFLGLTIRRLDGERR